MEEKKLLRAKYLRKRKAGYFEIKKDFFSPLINLIKKSHKRIKNIAIFYPTNHELNIFKIFEIDYFRKFEILLPAIESNRSMNFYKWKKNDVIFLNKFGVPEPEKSVKIIPHVILLPLLAYDKYKQRIGYGKGFYDNYLNNFSKKKYLITIGVAFSFQKYHKLPVNNKDFKLDYIITEKGII